MARCKGKRVPLARAGGSLADPPPDELATPTGERAAANRIALLPVNRHTPAARPRLSRGDLGENSMKKFLLLAPCVALVVACSGNSGNNASGNGTTGAATTGNGSADSGSTGGGGMTGGGGGGTMQAGQWEFTTRLTDMEVPGAPPQAQEQMRAQMGRERKETKCFTQAEVSNMAETLAQQSNQGASCDFSRRTFSGGTIDIAGTCRTPQGQSEMTMAGTYSGDTLQTTVNVNVSAGEQQMRMSATTNGRRIGECAG